jgi:hypothetical protein
MDYQRSHSYTFEKNIHFHHDINYLRIKLPQHVKKFEYQMVGDDSYHFLSKNEIKMEYLKEEMKLPSYILFAIPTIQILFFQISIYASNDKIIHYHEFIDMSEFVQDMKIEEEEQKQNITMNIQTKESDNEAEEEEYETEEED